MTSRGRLAKELKELQGAGRASDIDLWPDENNMHKWTAYIQASAFFSFAARLSRLRKGPEDTPFAGGTFKLAFLVPDRYPLAPPAVRFVTQVFHPNIHWKTGEVCLDILKDAAWSPAWTLQSVCRAIVALLACPEPDSPLNCDAGNLLRAGDTVGYNSMARCYTVELASAPPPKRGA